MNAAVSNVLTLLKQEIEESGGDEIEFRHYSGTDDPEGEPRIRQIVRRWAEDCGHTLRNPIQSQHFTKFSEQEARDWLIERLTKDLVFNCHAMNPWHARRVADSVLGLLEFQSAYRERFVVRNYAFSDIMLFSDKNDSIVIAFMGDD
jgi:hypothetical protein